MTWNYFYVQSLNKEPKSPEINHSSFQHSPTDKIKKELYHVIDRIFPPLAIRYLLVLQSNFPIQPSQEKSISEVIMINRDAFS